MGFVRWSEYEEAYLTVIMDNTPDLMRQLCCALVLGSNGSLQAKDRTNLLVSLRAPFALFDKSTLHLIRTFAVWPLAVGSRGVPDPNCIDFWRRLAAGFAMAHGDHAERAATLFSHSPLPRPLSFRRLPNIHRFPETESLTSIVFLAFRKLA